MRLALVHDWLTGMRGGENCLEAFCRVWPEADLFTLLHRPGSVSPTIENRRIHTSPLQCIPGVHRHYRWLLPLMPPAVESFDLCGYDLVLSSSHCVAKSVRVPPGVPHVCYCYTPMRYAWDLRDEYLRVERRESRVETEANSSSRRASYSRLSTLVSRLSRLPQRVILAVLRRWDRATARRVTHFIAISRTIQERIARCYGRTSAMIYPPVDTDFHTPTFQPRDDFYLIVSALVPYKRVDLAVQACHRLRRRLVVIGTGPESSRLRALAGPQTTFLGWQSNEVIREHYRRCRAILFPGFEDFGIVPLEAQACGAPVIAYAAGGALETVVAPTAREPGTGLFFTEQTATSLAGAVLELESRPRLVDPQKARLWAERFCTARFEHEIRTFVEAVLDGRHPEHHLRALATRRAA